MLPTWIFQRGPDHILLHCRENPRGVTLVVSGDGDLRSYSFRDFDALAKFEREMEEFLLETGWLPAHLTIEPLQTPDALTAQSGCVDPPTSPSRP
jgi:hypothetical protein